jgi:hypothetical protein
VDLPATCRAGICGACVARVASGTIDSSDIPDLEFTLNEVSVPAQCADMIPSNLWAPARMPWSGMPTVQLVLNTVCQH